MPRAKKSDAVKIAELQYKRDLATSLTHTIANSPPAAGLSVILLAEVLSRSNLISGRLSWLIQMGSISHMTANTSVSPANLANMAGGALSTLSSIAGSLLSKTPILGDTAPIFDSSPAPIRSVPAPDLPGFYQDPEAINLIQQAPAAPQLSQGARKKLLKEGRKK